MVASQGITIGSFQVFLLAYNSVILCPNAIHNTIGEYYRDIYQNINMSIRDYYV